MNKQNPFKYFKTSPEIIRLAVWYYYRFQLSYRQVEDILHERNIDISHETIRYWVTRFGQIFGSKIRKKRHGDQSNWQWHLDEVFVKINGELFYLWRAVDHEGEVLECYVSKRRNTREAKKFLLKIIKNHGYPRKITTDKLKSYSAALRELGLLSVHETGGRSNNRAENSHLPFRRQERVMQKFKSHKTLQFFTSTFSQIYNHFYHQRHLQKREYFKQLRNESLAEWRGFCAG